MFEVVNGRVWFDTGGWAQVVCEGDFVRVPAGATRDWNLASDITTAKCGLYNFKTLFVVCMLMISLSSKWLKSRTGNPCYCFSIVFSAVGLLSK